MTPATGVVDARLASALEFLAELRLPSGLRMGDSWERDPWLRDNICIPLLARNPDGKPSSRFAWCELPKGSGKTSTAAGLALVEAAMEPAVFVYVVACDREQASVLLDALSGLIDGYPRLKAQVTQRQSVFSLSNGSRIAIMSSDVPSFHGLGARARRLIFILEEITQWPSADLYYAAISSLAKHPDSALWVMTNAGLTDSWQAGAKEKLQAAGAFMHVSPPGWLPSWISEESIQAIRGTLPDPLWRRYYRNEWISGVEGAAISPEAWDACRTDVPALDPKTPLVVGVDAGIVSDSFAVIGVSRTSGEGKRELVTSDTYGLALLVPRQKEAAKVAVRAVKIWTPGGQPLDFAEPYDWLAGFCRSHTVRCIVYDSYQLWDWATRLGRESGTWMEAFEQGPRRAEADVTLLALIRSGRLLHDGNPELRQHALNASLKMAVREDSRARFVKSVGAKKIDGLIALSMAASQAMYLNLGQ